MEISKRVEKFIQDCTRNCSNEFEPQKAPPSVYNPWLTPDQARKAVEIAREEIIKIMLDEIEEAYYEGYHQAEKDMELTWKDMRDIYDLAYNLRFPHKKQKEFFEEVLKRFKDFREKKEK